MLRRAPLTRAAHRSEQPRQGRVHQRGKAINQLNKFDRALHDFSVSGAGRGRGIDGMLVTKWDTVDDKVQWARSGH